MQGETDVNRDFPDGAGLVSDVEGILSCQVRLVIMTFA